MSLHLKSTFFFIHMKMARYASSVITRCPIVVFAKEFANALYGGFLQRHG